MTPDVKIRSLAGPLTWMVKDRLRIRHSKTDEEIQDTIGACLMDLHTYGVEVMPYRPGMVDPLIGNAVKLYCQAHYTDDTGKAADYLARYDSLKASLAMSSDYRRGDI